ARSAKTIVVEAASRLGGTLPLTEGTAIPANKTANVTAGTAAIFFDNARLDEVLLGMKPSLMETYFTTKFGAPGAKTGTNPDLTYNSTTGNWDTSSGAAVTYVAADSYANISRIECAV